MRITIKPAVLAEMFKDGNELHVLIKSQIRKDDTCIGAQINKVGDIELLFENYSVDAEPVVIQTLPQGPANA